MAHLLAVGPDCGTLSGIPERGDWTGVETVSLAYGARRPQAADARARVGLGQEEFARLLGVSTRTLRDWERGKRAPSGAARTLIRVALRNPEALRDLRP